jgi:hypothetical protein
MAPERLARRMARAGYRRIGDYWLRKDSPKIRWLYGTAPKGSP